MRKNATITFTIQEVMTAVDNVKCNRILVKNYSIKLSNTVRAFREKGLKCDVCGIEGEYFELRVDTSTNSIHLDLVVKRSDRRVIMTRDHTIARHVGGKDNISNTVPMCSICNNEWKNVFDKAHKHRIAGISENGNEALILCT